VDPGWEDSIGNGTGVDEGASLGDSREVSQGPSIADAVAAMARGDVRGAQKALVGVTPTTAREQIEVAFVEAQALALGGRPDEAVGMTRTALARAGALDDPELEVDVLLALALARFQQREGDDVRALLSRALHLAVPGTESWGRVRLRQGSTRLAHGDFQRSGGALDEAAAVFQDLGLDWRVAEVRAQQALLALQHGEVGRAEELLAEAVALLGSEQAFGVTGAIHSIRAQCAWRRGELDLAASLLKRATEAYEVVGATVRRATCLVNLAELLRRSGRLEEARARYLELLPSTDARDLYCVGTLNLAILELEDGHVDEAARLASVLLDEGESSLGWYESVVHVLVLPSLGSEELLGRIRLIRGHYLERQVPRETDVPDVLLRVAQVFEDRGATDVAGDLYAIAYDVVERVGFGPDLVARAREALLRVRDAGARPWLGSARLEGLLGRGGMAAVWRAHDVLSGEDVAVKVISADQPGSSSSEQAAASLQREVAQVASLQHPAIVQVVDTGVVPPSAEVLSGGSLVAGSPFVTMELVDGGTLKDLRGRVDWPTTRRVLRVLLDALAHAHARGMVHMDLKPANVLVEAGSDGSPRRVKLADFGIARGFRDLGSDELTGGTPRYMAPEQVRKQVRVMGPWTDLYALGCVTIELLTGSPPFRGRREEILDAHLHRDVPPLRALCEVPEGLQAWLRRLLQKHPLDRFLRAADAALALAALDDQPMLPAALPTGRPISLETEDTWVLDDLEARPMDDEPSREGLAPILAPACRVTPPPEPPTRGRRGLAMLAHRAPTPIGRYGLRAELWRVLHDVQTTSRARWVELVAPPGLRVQALCEWLGFRAHEVGVASPLLIHEGETLAVAVARTLGLTGLSGVALRRQLATRGRMWNLDGGTLEALACSVEGGDVESQGDLWLEAVCRERGLVAITAKPSPAMRSLLARLDGRGMPLMGLSHRDPLEPPPLLPAPKTLSLEPLDDQELYDGLVDPILDPVLRWEVAERSEGCEAVALRMLRRYADRGQLVEGVDGLVRRPGFRSEFRVDPSPGWSARVQGWRDAVEPATWDALERVCMVPEPVPAERLAGQADALRELGWVREVPGGLLPRTSDLRRAVRLVQEGEGRLTASALACAEEGGWSPHGMAALWQWARRAEAAEAAYRTLLRARVGAGEALAATVVRRRWERMARQIGLDEDDPRWVEGQSLR